MLCKTWMNKYIHILFKKKSVTDKNRYIGIIYYP